MSEDLKLSLMIEAIDRFTAPAEKIAKVTDKLAHSLESGQKELNRLADAQDNITKFKSLESQLGKTASQLDNAKREVADLGRELKAMQKEKLDKPYKDMDAELKKLNKQHQAAQNRVDHLTKKHRELKQSTNMASDSLADMGVTSRTAARDQKTLSEAIDATQRKMERLAEMEAKVQRSEQRRDQALQRAANLSLVATSVDSAGRKMMRAIDGPLHQALSFQEAMAEVNKVVNFAEPDGLKKMANTILEMTKTIPLTKEELASIAAAGGQLGISEKDLPAYVEQVAKMSVAFDMMPDIAGESMAKLANVYDIPVIKIKDIGDAINYLSNNTAAKASDIVKVLSRVGGTARQFGLSATQVAALADAFIALGRPPEIASTAINAMLTKLQAAQVQSKQFKEGLNELGYSADEMADAVNTNAQGALDDLLARLKELDKGDRANIIAQMFGQEYSDDISLLVGGLDKYKQAKDMVISQTTYHNSQEKEFQAMASTSANKIRLMNSRWEALEARVGEKLLPVLDSLMDKVDAVTDWLERMNEKFPTMTSVILGTVGAIGGILIVASPVIAAIATLTASIAYLGHISRKAAIQGEVGAIGLGKKSGRLGRLGGKAGIAGAALGAMAVGSILMDEKASTADKVHDTTQTVGGIGGAMAGAAAGAVIGSVVPIIGTTIGGIVGGIAGGWAGDGLGGDVGTLLASLVSDDAKKKTNTMLASNGQPAPVHQSNDVYHLNITQLPGEDREHFANRVIELLQQKKLTGQLGEDYGTR